MTCTTFVNDSDFRERVGVPVIDEWLPHAQRALGQRIAICGRTFRTRRWFGRDITLYTVMLDLGHGQAQVVNFAPRDGSAWSINHYVPAQEVAAWLMGLSASLDKTPRCRHGKLIGDDCGEGVRVGEG